MKRIVYFVIFSLLFVQLVGAQNVTNSEQAALEAIDQAETVMNELSANNLNVIYFNDTIILMRSSLEQGNYDNVIRKLNELTQRREQAYQIFDSLRSLELRIEDLENMSLNMTEANELFNESLVHFENERYNDALKTIDKTNEKIAEIESNAATIGALIKAESRILSVYVREHIIEISTLAIIIALILFFSYRRIALKINKDELEDMKIELSVIRRLMKNAQKERYVEGSASKDDYDIRMDKYKDRMLELKRQMPVTRSRIKKYS